MKRKVIAVCIIFFCLTVCCSCNRSASKHEQNEISVSWNKSTNVILPSGERFESESFDYDGSTYVEIPLENISLKSKSHEHVGEIGRGEAAMCHAMATVKITK